MGRQAVRNRATHFHYTETSMSNVTYLHVIARQRAERRAALLRIARPTMVERIVYYFRRAFQ